MIEDAKRLLFAWLAMLIAGAIVLAVLYFVAIILLGLLWGWLDSGWND